ncbi:MAG: dTDP-4-dehydrorhamnose 3,5-epimerase [Thermoplasmataceae archaeon]
MPFEFRETQIKEVLLIIPSRMEDERGYFSETYKYSDFQKHGIVYDFHQDNQSFSKKGVLRGLHFQSPPHTQGKLVRTLVGKILDIAVDIRIGSPTYGKYVTEELSSDNGRMLWVPPGFAHGFYALEDSVIHYKATGEYNKNSEGGLLWSDKTLSIRLPNNSPIVSQKDNEWPTIDKIKSPFHY